MDSLVVVWRASKRQTGEWHDRQFYRTFAEVPDERNGKGVCFVLHLMAVSNYHH